MKKFLTLFWSALLCLTVSAKDDSVVLLQNNPNPFDGSTNVYLALENPGETHLVIADIYGNVQTQWAQTIEAGVHKFRISIRAKGNYVAGAHQNGKKSSIVMFCNTGGAENKIEYQGSVDANHEMAFQNLIAEDSQEEFVHYMPVNADMKEDNPAQEPFRVALSLSPFSLKQFELGYSFQVGDQTASTPEELQQIFMDLGSTEMYVRLATKRHKTYMDDQVTLKDSTDGIYDENANVHTFDQVMQTCRIAAKLNIPINPEVMCAYIYMDMDGTQAPRFYKDDYPELYNTNPTWARILKDGEAKWEELSLNDICTVLEIYGEFVADSILATGATVNNWNLGNEANFGFAGIGIGTPNSFDRKLAKAGKMKRFMSSLFSVWWLKKHVWCYEARTLAAVKKGILKAYEKKHLPTDHLKFSTHIATVVSTPRSSASFFTYMAQNGYAMETAGISYYPSAPAMSVSKKKLLTNTVTRINKKCGIPVFIGEFSYPSENMVGPFAGWNKQIRGYSKTQQGQADVYRDVIAWGKEHGMVGIRYWAPDYEGEWYPMSMFEFNEDKVGTAKLILTNHKEIVK